MCQKFYRLILLEFITMKDALLTNYFLLFFLVSYGVLPKSYNGFSHFIKKIK